MSSTYSFLDVSVNFVGPPAFAFEMGYGAATAEEGITITMTEDKNTMLAGAGGAVMHSLHAAKTGQLTVRTLKTSALNQRLMLAYVAQQQSSALWGLNVITVRNVAQQDVVVCTQCAFKKQPDLTYAKDGGTMEWVFDVGHVNAILGS